MLQWVGIFILSLLIVVVLILGVGDCFDFNQSQREGFLMWAGGEIPLKWVGLLNQLTY